jgi:hypothetical protein
MDRHLLLIVGSFVVNGKDKAKVCFESMTARHLFQREQTRRDQEYESVLLRTRQEFAMDAILQVQRAEVDRERDGRAAARTEARDRGWRHRGI